MAEEAKAGGDGHGPEKPAKSGGSLMWMLIAAGASLASAGGTFLVVSRSATHGDEAPAAHETKNDDEEGHGKAKEEEKHGGEEHEAEAKQAPPKVEAKDEHEEEEKHGSSGGHEESEGHGGGGGGHSSSDAPAVFQLETFVVNINDGERDRFLKLKPELELSGPGVSDELKANMPQVKDTIISLLSSQSFSQIRSVEGKDLLREEMMVRLNAMLRSGKVARIFFTEFVVQ